MRIAGNMNIEGRPVTEVRKIRLVNIFGSIFFSLPAPLLGQVPYFALAFSSSSLIATVCRDTWLYRCRRSMVSIVAWPLGLLGSSRLICSVGWDVLRCSDRKEVKFEGPLDCLLSAPSGQTLSLAAGTSSGIQAQHSYPPLRNSLLNSCYKMTVMLKAKLVIVS